MTDDLQELFHVEQCIQTNAKAGIKFREGVFLEMTASATPDGPWQPGAMRCHPWVAVAFAALTPAQATELAAELEEALAAGFPAWRGWGIEYPAFPVVPVAFKELGPFIKVGEARAYVEETPSLDLGALFEPVSPPKADE